MLNNGGSIEFVVKCADCGTTLAPTRQHYDTWDGAIICVPCCPVCAEGVYQDARTEAYAELEDVDHD